MYEIRDSRKETRIFIRGAIGDDAVAVRTVALGSGIDAWTIDQYRDEAGRSDALFLVAIEDSGVVGFVSGRVVPGTSEGTDGEIYNIAVSEGSRGKGIGRALLKESIEGFTSNCCRSLWLEVRESNSKAIKFYENNGFRRVTTRRNFYSAPNEHAIVMRLTLGEPISEIPIRSA